jgi:hypothetical protein
MLRVAAMVGQEEAVLQSAGRNALSVHAEYGVACMHGIRGMSQHESTQCHAASCCTMAMHGLMAAGRDSQAPQYGAAHLPGQHRQIMV